MLHYTHSSRQSGDFCQSTAWKWRFKEGNEFFVSLAKGIKLQKFNNSLWFTLWFIWVLQNGLKSTGFCDVLLYITVQMYQSCMLAGTVISVLHWGPPCPLVDFCINMHHPVLISSLWMYLFLWNVLRCSSEENQKYLVETPGPKNWITSCSYKHCTSFPCCGVELGHWISCSSIADLLKLHSGSPPTHL